MYIHACCTFYVGMGRVQNNRLIRYMEQLCDNHSKVSQNTYRQKAFVILLFYPTQKLKKKTKMNIILLSFFLLPSWMLYRWNECSTTESGAFSGLKLYVSHDWWVMAQNTHHSCLPRCHFVHTFGDNLQSIGCTLAFYILNNFSTLLFELLASFDWWTTCMSLNTHHDCILVWPLRVPVTFKVPYFLEQKPPL